MRKIFAALGNQYQSMMFKNPLYRTFQNSPNILADKDALDVHISQAENC